VADFIQDYRSGELAPFVREEFDRHLALCPNCRRYIALYEAAIDMGRRAFADENEAADAAGVPQDLIDAIRASRLAEPRQ
jgi:anti-sigma factor RsiW